MAEGKNIYQLIRGWFDFAFENPELIKPNHAAIFVFAIEHCNRLGWKEKFGFPSQMAMEAVGIKNWRTYSKALNDLVDWGFIEMIEKSKNQYSSNIIAIVFKYKAPTKALDKALLKHLQKQGTKQGQSIDSVDKQTNNGTSVQIHNRTASEEKFYNEVFSYEEFTDDIKQEFFNYWTEKKTNGKKFRFELERTWDTKRRLARWKKNDETNFGRKEKKIDIGDPNYYN